MSVDSVAVVAYAFSFIVYDFHWLETLVSQPFAHVLQEVALQSHLQNFARLNPYRREDASGPLAR